MIVVATFANRTYDPEIIELVCAWDEFSIESNYDGWRSERQTALDSWGADLLRVVDVQIQVPMADIDRALNPEVTITAEVVGIDDPDPTATHTGPAHNDTSPRGGGMEER